MRISFSITTNVTPLGMSSRKKVGETGGKQEEEADGEQQGERDFADNIASRKLMERLGMRLEDHAVRDFLHRSGQWLDSLRYAILEDEWRAGPTNAS